MELAEILKCIAEDMWEPVSYIPEGMLLGLVPAFCMAAVQILRDRKLRFGKLLAAFLLGTYGAVVLQQSFLSRPPGSRTTVCMEILGTWKQGAQSKAYVIENVLMFIPFGALLPVCMKRARTIFCILPLSFMLSVCLEYAQYMTERGHCQADDVLMNAIGGSLGYLLFLLLWGIRILWHKKRKAESLPQEI